MMRLLVCLKMLLNISKVERGDIYEYTGYDETSTTITEENDG